MLLLGVIMKKKQWCHANFYHIKPKKTFSELNTLTKHICLQEGIWLQLAPGSSSRSRSVHTLNKLLWCLIWTEAGPPPPKGLNTLVLVCSRVPVHIYTNKPHQVGTQARVQAPTCPELKQFYRKWAQVLCGSNCQPQHRYKW